MMKGTMMGVSLVYFLLVANFYNESHGFTKFYNSYYALWKITPIAFLVFFCLAHGGGMSRNNAVRAAAGVAFGGLGDYLIGVSHDGIVSGAIAFGIGHFIYMSMFFSRSTPIHWPSLISVLAWGAFLGHICLMPLLSTQPVAVIIMSLYSLTLSACVVMAISQYLNRSLLQDAEPLRSRLLGFSLFFFSDSLLILTHSGFSVLPHPEVFILGSYYSAQLFILNSFVGDAHYFSAAAIKIK